MSKHLPVGDTADTCVHMCVGGQEEIDLMVHEVDDNNDGDIDFEGATPQSYY